MKAEMRQQPGRPLIPPLAAARPNIKPSSANVEKADATKPTMTEAKRDRPIRTFFCSGCGGRAEGYNVSPGWVVVKRIHARGSKLPPPAIRDQPKALTNWLRRPPELSLGLYCSVTCLSADQARLAEEERRLNANAVGLKPLDELRELVDALKS